MPSATSVGRTPSAGRTWCCTITAPIGPVRSRIYARYAIGDRTRLDAHEGLPLRLFSRVLPILARARLRGDHAQSPFFDARTRAPIAAPAAIRS